MSRVSGRTIGLIVFILVALLLLVVGLSSGNARQQTGANMLALMPAAFLSGLLSFLSPCTLPILPAYFAYSFQSQKKNVLLMTVAFFLGLASTMVVLGASATAIGGLLVTHLALLSFVGGLVIIGFGLLSIAGKGFGGVQFQDNPAGTVIGSFVYGATFSIGWTACIGPILGAILTLLATQGAAVLQGAILGFIYALGLGMPLIIISAFFSRLGNGSWFWKVIRGKGYDLHLGSIVWPVHTTSLLSGALLIAVGALLLSGKLTAITQLAAGSSLSVWVVQADAQIRLLFGLR
jgi:cytochrome c-type biogenesis protein